MGQQITDDDLELVKLAREAIASRYRPGWHSVGSALRIKSGRVYTSIHIDANVGRIAVCAEAVAVANAVFDGESEFDTIVAVQHPKNPEEDFRVVSPCGMCREIVTDYDKNSNVIIDVDGVLKKLKMIELLPHKYL